MLAFPGFVWIARTIGSQIQSKDDQAQREDNWKIYEADVKAWVYVGDTSNM